MGDGLAQKLTLVINRRAERVWLVHSVNPAQAEQIAGADVLFVHVAHGERR